MQELEKYLRSFTRLHVDRSHGVAPHKPVLLLSVLQSYANNLISDNRIFLTPELVALFRTNWNLLVVTQHDCRISYPFFYLKSDNFWKLISKPGYREIENMGSVMKSFNSINSVIDHAEIEENLAGLMRNKQSNQMLQQILLDQYFPETKLRFVLDDVFPTNLFSSIENKILREDPAQYRTEIQKLLEENDDEEIFLRGSVFKREVPKIYNFSCCISGMRINLASSVSMIDACHIIPFKTSFNDTITNGISLCPNLHRAFDRGLITIDTNYKVTVSRTFTETESTYSLKGFDGMKISLPNDPQFYPSKESLIWHNTNIYERKGNV